jgi:pyruvate formate lyase activating enzyme
LEKSVKIIKASGLPYEFRTTVVPGLLEKADFAAMGEAIRCAKKWYLQKFKSNTGLVDASYEGHPPYTDQEMAEFAAIGRQDVDFCEVRG